MIIEGVAISQHVRETFGELNCEFIEEERPSFGGFISTMKLRVPFDGGHAHIDVDLINLIDWLKTNKPELLK